MEDLTLIILAGIFSIVIALLLGIPRKLEVQWPKDCSGIKLLLLTEWPALVKGRLVLSRSVAWIESTNRQACCWIRCKCR